jgi:hypothetical protein
VKGSINGDEAKQVDAINELQVRLRVRKRVRSKNRQEWKQAGEQDGMVRALYETER